MKRLILDFEKDGEEYVYKLYHPLSDARDGYVTYSSEPASIIEDLSKNIVEYLPTIPSLEIALTKKFVQESANWYYIHRDKLNAYELTIQSLVDERTSLEAEVKELKSKLKYASSNTGSTGDSNSPS